MKKPFAPIAWWLLLGITIFQWALISYLLQERHSQNLSAEGAAASTASTAGKSAFLAKPVLPEKSLVETSQAVKGLNLQEATKKVLPPPKGVAATILFQAPAWFHRRYPVLLQNYLAIIPAGWIIQLFVRPNFWEEQVLPAHPGLTRLLEEHHDRIVVTELPKAMHHLKQPNQRIPLDPWFWETMVAEPVLFFSGNGMMCANGNTQERWERLMTLDYVGVPFTQGSADRPGGDGSTHSYRNRTVMLQALKYAKDSKTEPTIPEHVFFVDILQKMQQSSSESSIRVATPEDSSWFGGVQTTNSTVKGHLRPIPQPPMLVSGTQAKLSFQHRDDLLMVCPELKGIFPSLHEPGCFGAHPDPPTCKASICALRDEIPGSGC